MDKIPKDFTSIKDTYYAALTDVENILKVYFTSVGIRLVSKQMFLIVLKRTKHDKIIKLP